MEKFKRLKATSVTTKIIQTFLFGFIIAFCTFLLLYKLSNIFLDDFFLNSSYIKTSSQRYIQDLQQYVNENNVSATDSEQLQAWTIQNGISIFSVSRERVLIYDNTYVGNAQLFEAESMQLHNVWQYFHTVQFADGDADVYLYKNFKHNFYLVADVIAAFLSALVWIVVFVLRVRNEVKYIIMLQKEVQQMQDGTLENGFTRRGNDELTDLATALERMRSEIIVRESREQQLKANQEKLVLGMAHDLRTPLTGLMGYLEICKKNGSSPESISFIDKAMDKAIQIKGLSDKLFEYFLANNQSTCTLDPPAPAEFLLADYLSDMCFQLSNSHYRVDSSLLSWRYVTIQINSDFIARISNNIISNIEKYADPLKDVIISSTYNEHYCGVNISNHICQNRTSVQGTRIGINNIEKMMQLMGGYCEISSSEDTFQITLWFPIINRA